MRKCQKDPTCGIFLKRGLFKDIKNPISMCRTHKYKNINTKYTNTAYDEVPERPKIWLFLKRGLFKGIKNYNPICRKKKDCSRVSKLYSHVSNAQIQIKNTQIHKYSI